MMTFTLVAFLELSGQIHAFYLDAGLTYEDCRTAVAVGVNEAAIFDGLSVNLDGAALVCELEIAR